MICYTIQEANIEPDPPILFQENNPNWSVSIDNNYAFIKAQERYFNDLLRVRGHVFLNEIYDALGFKRTSFGAVAGYSHDANNYIDFGLSAQCTDKFYIELNFNLPSLIWDRI